MKIVCVWYDFASGSFLEVSARKRHMGVHE